MRHEKYGSIATAHEMILLDVLEELQKLNRNMAKLSPVKPSVKKAATKKEVDKT